MNPLFSGRVRYSKELEEYYWLACKTAQSYSGSNPNKCKVMLIMHRNKKDLNLNDVNYSSILKTKSHKQS